MTPARHGAQGRVEFVGPLPPPVNGFSNVCAMMLDMLRSKLRVDVFDRAPAANGRIATMRRQLARSLRYLAVCVTERGGVLYLALSGGRGQIIDMSYLLLGKLFRRRVFVHHHSFAYITRASLLNRCCFALIRKDAHIVLSQKMGESLASLYGLDPGGIRVVSNAAFYDPANTQAREARDDAAPLHIGFLSNITFEKGFVEFFAILAELKNHGVAYRAHIAGPLSPDAQETFHKLLDAADDVEYVGPIYGVEKERFYQQLDIFLFPTNYANEAEPLVVYEAMRRGVFVIACDRGAISEMLRNGAGIAFAAATIVEGAVKHIAQFNADRRALASARQLSLSQAQRIRSSGRTELEKLVDRMRGPAGHALVALAMLACASLWSNPALSDIAAPDHRDTLDRAVAAPDEVDPTTVSDIFAPYVADDVAYDSNLYRLPASVTDLSALHGIGSNPSRSDTTNSASAGLDAQWLPGNRQTIDLDLRADDNRYFHNTNLDDISSADRLAWNWGLGGALSGQVGADFLRTFAGFNNTDTYSEDMIDRTEYFAAGRYQIGPRWALFGGLLDTRYVFTAEETAFNNSQTKAVDMGGDYLTDAGNRIALDYRYTDSRYPNTIQLGDTSFNPDYREDRIRMSFKYTLSDKTLINVNGGYLKRSYPSDALGGFSGEIWRVAFQWQATLKTQLVVGAWQELDADLTAQTDYFVAKGVNLEPIWAASEKVSLSLTLQRENHDYVGATPAGTSSLLVAPVDITQARHDTVTSEMGSIVYTPTSALTLTLNAGHEVRDSNTPEFQYNDFRGDASINFKF
ncbi:MAG: glycosyltransferase [Steroidobacteraceae bacterium]